MLAAFEMNFPDKPEIPPPGGPDAANEQIPAGVRGLDKKKVQIRGFMMPVQISGTKTTEFMLMKDPLFCCFAITPRINDWISVKTPDKGFDIVMDQPVTVEGTFHVGANRDSKGYVLDIYRMDGQSFLAADSDPSAPKK